MREIGLENHRRLSHLPQQPPLAGATKARFMVSWWGQEIRIWVFQQSAEAVRGLLDEAELKKNRRLLKKIVVNTESNISSVVISPDGTFLAASSASSGIRAWRLDHKNPTVPKELRVTELTLPEAFSEVGAASLTISPDGRWLCMVEEGSDVSVARISVADGSKVLSLPQKTQRLKRLRRDVPRHKLLGGLGTYDRSITKTCFSPDSRMLATVDLAGYIDTWILRDADDTAGSGEDASSSSDDFSDDDSDAGATNGASEPKEKWARNPAGAQLPKLSSTPVVLSFSPDVPRPLANGTSADDAAPHDDYTLLAVTTPFEVLTFHPRRGTLTDWSRRNKRAQMPPQMLDIRDVAMGAVWSGEHAVIYGPSFVFKLHTGLDTRVSASQAQKRKRVERDHGAGSKMQVGALGPHKVYKLDGTSKEPAALGNEVRHEEVVEMSDDEEEEVRGGELEALREREGEEGSRCTDGGRRWRLETKFRPILGIAPVGEAEGAEVALVERPLWEIELPERYGEGKERTYY